MSSGGDRFGGDEWWNRQMNPIKSLWSMSSISPKTQRHLVSVYSNLTATAAMAAFANVLTISGWLPSIGIAQALLPMGILFALAYMDPSEDTTAIRTGMLLSFGFAEGWSIAPLVEQAFQADQGTVLLAILSTALGFTAFSLSAFSNTRRSYLYLGGLLGTMLSMSLLLSIAQLFYPSATLFSGQLYFGLFIFSLYVLYDTQVIIARAESRSHDTHIDAVQPAAHLFTDFFAIFVRVLIILYEMQRERERKQREEQLRKGSRRSRF